MKKYILLIAALFILSFGYSQIQASFGGGDAPGRIKIYLKPGVTMASCVFSTLQFNAALPQGIAFPSNLIMTVVSSAFPFAASNWIVDPPYLEGGYINFNIHTAQSGYTLPITANVEFEAIQVKFTSNLLNGNYPNAAHLVCLPDGGIQGAGNALFYCTGSVFSDGSNLYYARDANVTVSNGTSYRTNNPLNVTSFARYGPALYLGPSGSLPIQFKDFTVTKKDNNALLSWWVENETAVTDHYEVERSVNGIDFTRFASVPPKLTGGSNSYNLTDFNLSTINSSGVIYYRIKQYDKDGKYIYSEIRTVRLDPKFVFMNVYPNPVKDITNVTLDLFDKSDVYITIVNVSGKEVQQLYLLGNKGVNIQKVNMSKLSSGFYLIKVQADGKTKTIPVVKAQ